MANRTKATLMPIDFFVRVLVRSRPDCRLEVQWSGTSSMQVLTGADEGRLGQSLQIDALTSDPGILMVALSSFGGKRRGFFLQS